MQRHAIAGRKLQALALKGKNKHPAMDHLDMPHRMGRRASDLHGFSSSRLKEKEEGFLNLMEAELMQ